jgi:hypothetical protein
MGAEPPCDPADSLDVHLFRYDDLLEQRLGAITCQTSQVECSAR